jgi:hypothetical protein
MGHSSPGNTRLRARKSCRLPRNLPPRPSIAQINPLRPESLQPKYNTRVQKQFALCIAASCPPAEAIKQIETRLPPHKLTDGVANFLDALKHRLRHRVALFADTTFMDYLLSSEGTELSSPSSIRNGSYASFLDDSVSQWSKKRSTAMTHQKLLFVARHRPCIRASTEVYEDEARRIWQHVRRTSRRD